MITGLLKNADHFFFGKMQAHYMRMLEKEVNGCESLLDVGCGTDSPVKKFSSRMKKVVGIDAHPPSIEKSRAAGIHHEYYRMNVLEMDQKFGPKSFDCVVASDLIEHLTKEDGYRLMKMMEGLARKKAIIYTPNGFLEQGEYDNNPYQVHLSGWEIDEMQEQGYRVYGINGWKFLKGEYAEIRFRPKVLWGRISLLTQKMLEQNPRHAFGIMCVKEFGD